MEIQFSLKLNKERFSDFRILINTSSYIGNFIISFFFFFTLAEHKITPTINYKNRSLFDLVRYKKKGKKKVTANKVGRAWRPASQYCLFWSDAAAEPGRPPRPAGPYPITLECLSCRPFAMLGAGEGWKGGSGARGGVWEKEERLKETERMRG